MAVDFMQYALEFMQVYGLYAIFVLLVLDGAMLLPAVPGEIILILAMSQYGQDMQGFVVVFGLAVIAAMVGALVLYGIGRGAAGKPGKKRKRVFGMSPKKQEKMEKLFAKPSGQSMVFFMRLFPLTRILVSVPAGIARMPFWRFFVISVIGTIVFYAGFLWLTYEFQDPNSEIALTAAGVREAYGSPAMEYIEANWIITGAILIVIGIIASVRGSRKMSRDADETSGSLLGTLATAALFWGGIAVLVGLWLDSKLVFKFIELGGVELAWLNVGLPYEPLSTVAGVAGIAILIAMLMRAFRRTARKENKRLAAEAQKLEFQGRSPQPGRAMPTDVESIPSADAGATDRSEERSS